jgi:hypothetical protein
MSADETNSAVGDGIPNNSGPSTRPTMPKRGLSHLGSSPNVGRSAKRARSMNLPLRVSQSPRSPPSFNREEEKWILEIPDLTIHELLQISPGLHLYGSALDVLEGEPFEFYVDSHHGFHYRVLRGLVVAMLPPEIIKDLDTAEKWKNLKYDRAQLRDAAERLVNFTGEVGDLFSGNYTASGNTYQTLAEYLAETDDSSATDLSEDDNDNDNSSAAITVENGYTSKNAGEEAASGVSSDESSDGMSDHSSVISTTTSATSHDSGEEE